MIKNTMKYINLILAYIKRTSEEPEKKSDREAATWAGYMIPNCITPPLNKINLVVIPLTKCKWLKVMIPGASFKHPIQRNRKNTNYLFQILNCCVPSNSGGTTHNACALALKHTCAHTFISKHAPLVPTLKPHSQECSAESSSKRASSLGEEIIRICAIPNLPNFISSQLYESNQIYHQWPEKWLITQWHDWLWTGCQSLISSSYNADFSSPLNPEWLWGLLLAPIQVWVWGWPLILMVPLCLGKGVTAPHLHTSSHVIISLQE